jgi:hypothetical protein
MTRRILAISGALAMASIIGGGALAETFETNAISFRDITGSIEIATTTGDTIDIEIRQGAVHHPVTLVEEDGVVVVAGEKWREEEDRNCCDSRILREFHPREGRELTTGEPVDEGFFEDYPTIVVSMPFEGDVEFLDARMKLQLDRLDGSLLLEGCYVYGETSDLDEAVIGLVHGSRLVIGNVAGGLEIDISGDADLRAGDAAIVDVDIAGPGDVVLGDVTGLLDVSIAGSGLVRATRVDGPVTARIAGSGGLGVMDGRADRLRVTIDGSGGVFFGGAAVQPELRLFGSSEVRLGAVSGRIIRHGGGAVYVGDELVPRE